MIIRGHFQEAPVATFKTQQFRPDLHDVGLLFMPDRLYESDTGNAPECECLHKELYRIVGAERIGFMRSRVNKTSIRHEKESDTWVIRYSVNGPLMVV